MGTDTFLVETSYEVDGDCAGWDKNKEEKPSLVRTHSGFQSEYGYIHTIELYDVFKCLVK